MSPGSVDPDTICQKKTILPAIMLVICALAVLGIYMGYFIYTRNSSASNEVTLPAPLENVDFSPKTQQYPEDWPEAIEFPDDFVLIDLSSGTLPESTAQGWAIKLIFEGTPSDTVNIISSFLEKKGWTIVEKDKLDSGGFVLLVQQQQGSGIITLDPNPNNSAQTLIVASIFP